MRKRLFVILILVASLADVFAAGLAGAQPPEEVGRLIQGLQVGEPVYYENLTMIPVYASGRYPSRTNVTLEQALRNGWLSVTEIDDGQVPRVRLTSHVSQGIFIMAGEIISGGKQDRIMARDVLLRPRAQRVIVPVYCVEQGRWRRETDAFYSKANLGTPNLRARVMAEPAGAQQAVWDSVAKDQRALGVRSATQAYQEAYEQKGVREDVSRYEEKFLPLPRLNPDIIGVVVAVGGRIVSADVFRHPAMFQELWPKIVKSSALAALSEGARGQVRAQDAAVFLRRLYDLSYNRQPAVDAGQEYAGYSWDTRVHVLTQDRAVVHLAAFVNGSGRYDDRQPDDDHRIPVMPWPAPRR